ncbi:FAD-dependent oxidoreductase [Bradyrhizobium sp. WYCCWR 13022]|uniref:FAD-dependent oxidoreductase n=1 Tax=unclassified Bradyrhizobium TaxID=2631580 RepID=UPI00263A8151|nr:FAD-dependent oxidoreductase [Bradyrhizobium sp. WYCCWR 13022]MDN4984321.1 FAD-dependent oxidoreductase [Bradyrhizobium sp. WYCCWR 13022]
MSVARAAKAVDVIVVGSGAAGLVAAVFASLSGSSVVILEAADEPGGTTGWSDGAFWAPNNHFLKAKGLDDPRDDALRFMASTAFPGEYVAEDAYLGIGRRRYAALAAFYDKGGHVFETLQNLGALVTKHANRTDMIDHSLLNKRSRGRVMVVMRPDGQRGFGEDIVGQLRDYLDRQGVPLLLNHRVMELQRNRTGRVDGVVAQTPSAEVRILARRGVVFASGGFVHDHELLRSFQQTAPFAGTAAPTNRGDFIRISAKVGAALGNMAHGWRSQIVLEQALDEGIAPSHVLQPSGVPRHYWQSPGDSCMVVNKKGHRVVNEKRAGHEVSLVHYQWDAVESEFTNRLLFMIYDRRARDVFAGNYPLPHPGETAGYIIEAATIADLAIKIQGRLDNLKSRIGEIRLADNFADALSREIELFETEALSGVDARFARGHNVFDTELHREVFSIARTDTNWPPHDLPNVTMYPFQKEGPFYCIIVAPSLLDTNGGPITDETGRVIDVDGKIVPGLFAAGNCSASPAGQAYWAPGATMGLAAVFGAIAGESAALEPSNIGELPEDLLYDSG